MRNGQVGRMYSALLWQLTVGSDSLEVCIIHYCDS